MSTTPMKPAPLPGDGTVLRRIFSSSNMVLFMVCLMYGLTYIDRVNVNTAGPVFQKELHLNTSQLGWVFSAFGWAYLALQVWGGWLSDRFGARLALTVCGIIWAGATIMAGLAGSFAVLIVARVILGLGEGATFPTATRALADWFPPEKRGFTQEVKNSTTETRSHGEKQRQKQPRIYTNEHELKIKTKELKNQQMPDSSLTSFWNSCNSWLLLSLFFSVTPCLGGGFLLLPFTNS